MMSSTNLPEKQGNLLDSIAEGAGVRPNPRLDQRAKVDRLLSRASYLKPADRVLLTNLYVHGLTPGEMAAVAGTCAQTVRRRAQNLCQHLNSEIFTFVLTHRSRWAPERRRVAELRYLQRCTLSETARRSGLSMHHVRQHTHAIRENLISLRP